MAPCDSIVLIRSTKSAVAVLEVGRLWRQPVADLTILWLLYPQAQQANKQVMLIMLYIVPAGTSFKMSDK